MIALVRFQISGYLRSFRVLQPLIVVLLLVSLVLLQGTDDAGLAAGALGDVPAFLFAIWAWTARALLDTQPDDQRALSALTTRRHAAAGLLAAYTVNLALGAVAAAVPLGQAIATGVSGPAIASGVGLLLLVALAGTVLGALTSRVLIPDPGISLITLITGVAAALLLSMSPLRWIAVPMVDWLRAAHDGPAELAAAFPGVALHLAAWTAVLAALYLTLRRTRT
ncbi:hypothetical protein [Spirillospora sp. NPDC029432]|uniref:hypothetical protein n=1 Tax=Spirillospora sp. NPDC029432 TaxID=3154599 RepID=UPI0034542995